MKKIIQILTIAGIMLALSNQSMAMMSGPQTQRKVAEFNRALQAGDFTKAQSVIDELRTGRRTQEVQRLTQQLQQAQAGRGAPSTSATAPIPAGLLETCDQQLEFVLNYFGRYPAGQSISGNKKAATKDLLFDAYQLLEDIGIPRQTSPTGPGLRTTATGAPDPYKLDDDVFTLIKRHFDILKSPATGLPQLLQILDDRDGNPSINAQDAIKNFTNFGKFFDNAKSLSQIWELVQSKIDDYRSKAVGSTRPATLGELLEAAGGTIPDEIKAFIMSTGIADPNVPVNAVVDSLQRAQAYLQKNNIPNNNLSAIIQYIIQGSAPIRTFLSVGTAPSSDLNAAMNYLQRVQQGLQNAGVPQVIYGSLEGLARYVADSYDAAQNIQAFLSDRNGIAATDLTVALANLQNFQQNVDVFFPGEQVGDNLRNLLNKLQVGAQLRNRISGWKKRLVASGYQQGGPAGAANIPLVQEVLDYIIAS